MLKIRHHERDLRLARGAEHFCFHLQIRMRKIFEEFDFLVDVSDWNPFDPLEKNSLLAVSMLVGVQDISAARVNPSRYSRNDSGAVGAVQKSYDSFFFLWL